MKNRNIFILMAFICILGVTFVTCDNETTNDPPTAPTITTIIIGSLTPTLATGLEVNVNFSATGDITSFDWQPKVSNPTTLSVAVTGSTARITGFTKSGTYVIELKATNTSVLSKTNFIMI